MLIINLFEKARQQFNFFQFRKLTQMPETFKKLEVIC